jgi:hypothetical protein
MFKHENGTIHLNGMRIPLETFRKLEPAYAQPDDIVVMFYDGVRRHYRTKHRSWTVWGKWDEGERYLQRASDFASLLAEENRETADAIQEVKRAKARAVKDKYPVEGNKNVELHARDDLNKGGTKGIRSKGKRTSRNRGKHSGGATGRSSE